MKLYFDNTVLAALTYFKDRDTKRYAQSRGLIKRCKENKAAIVTKNQPGIN